MNQKRKYTIDEIITVIAIMYLSAYILLPAMVWIPSILRILLSMISIVLIFIGILKKSTTSFIKITLLSVMIIIFNLLFYYSQSNLVTSNLFTKNYRFFIFWISFTITVYLNLTTKKYLVKFVLDFILVLAVVTSITTIIGLMNYEFAARELASPNFPELSMFYYQRNIGDYGFIYSLVFFLPIAWLIVKKRKKYIYIFILIIFYLTIIFSQYTTALLFSFVIPIPIILNKTKPKNIIVILLITILLYPVVELGIINFINVMIKFANNYDLEFLKLRLDQLYLSLTTEELVGGVGYRFNLYHQSFDAFIKQPIVGNLGSNQRYTIGEHSEILDLLASMGILGLMYLSYIIYRIHIIVKKDSNTNNYIFYSLITLISFAFINTIFSSPQIGFMFFIMPSYIVYARNFQDLKIIQKENILKKGNLYYENTINT